MEIVENLRKIIDDEYEALTSGELNKLSEILEKKTFLLSNLTLTPKDLEKLRLLRMKIRRNHILFDKSLSGIRQVISRHSLVQSAAKAVETYDASGRKTVIKSDDEVTLMRKV